MRFSTAILLILLVISCNDASRHQKKMEALHKENESLHRENDSLRSECSSKDIDLGRYDFIISNMSKPCVKEFDSISSHAE